MTTTNYALAQPDQIVAHTVSIAAIFAAFFHYIPAVAALVPAIYYMILIWESKTIRRRLRLHRMRKRAAQLVLLKAEAIKAKARVKAEAVIAQAVCDKAATEAASVEAVKHNQEN